MVPKEAAERWLDQLLALDRKKVDPAAFAATQLAWMGGDRARALSEDARAEVAERLKAYGGPPSWVRMVTEVATFEAADERRIFGESPRGSRLLVE